LRTSGRSICLPIAIACLALTSAAEAVTIDWAVVGGPGNPCDSQIWNCPGAVSTVYRIAKHEVTNGQYVEFLNAKAASDPLGLYSTEMGIHGGIQRNGSAGSYTYSSTPGREAMPVNFVSFYDAIRFVNWLHNGQGSGPTETGSYTLLGGTPIPSNEPLTRNAGAMIFMPTDDEWYKAAYYDVGTASYFVYPAGTDTQTVCSAPGATPNTANCGLAVGDFTSVGSYTGSASPNGTFDQGGNAVEWADQMIILENRIIRGGHIGNTPVWLSGARSEYDDPWFENSVYGFRVAGAVPPGDYATNLRASDSGSTWFEWDFLPGTAGAVFDLVRGDVANLAGNAGGIDLGPLTCIENDSADESSQSAPDEETPPVQGVFFYLVRFQQGPMAGPWGSGSDGRMRTGSSGCLP
jgi:formylglycine-generating enzyme required for sulfatase activity